MHPNGTRLTLKHWAQVMLCAVIVVFGAVLMRPTVALSAVRVDFEFGLHAVAAAAPGIEGHVHRMFTRAERFVERLGTAVTTAAVTWLWIFPSAVLFLVVAAIASATDRRMLDLRHHGLAVLARDLSHGVRMFFRIARDRRTPYLPRAILVLALLYWVLPLDLVGDGIPMVGMLDDVLVAVVAAKLFIRLCPDAVVAAHAAAVRAHA